MTNQSPLEDWLHWQESAHTRPIDMGLDRVASVYQTLTACHPPKRFTITIAGTNGKGSSAAMLESILTAAGYRTGVYSTPHVLRYNERIRIDQQSVDDAAICSAFEAIDRARGAVSLSYFEFGTLAALWLFDRASVDIQILEVGMGGRLDAVNIIDADMALITTIHLDHAEWLGTDRSSIAIEKAGVFRSSQFAVCADPTVPRTLIDRADALGTELICAGRDYQLDMHDFDQGRWSIQPATLMGDSFPVPKLPGAHQVQNAAGVVQIIHGINTRFNHRFTITKSALDAGLAGTVVLGRMQRVNEHPAIWLDVAHNPQSAAALADFFTQQPIEGRRFAVMAAMADKDLEGIVEPLWPIVDQWFITTLETPRAASTAAVRAAILRCDPNAEIVQFDDVETLWKSLRRRLHDADGVVGFGSFYLVEASMRAL